MKIGFLTLILAAAIPCSSAFASTPGDPCGKLQMGSYTVDVAARTDAPLMTKNALIENFQSGVAFLGSDQCPGTYEIVGLQLYIQAKDDLSIEYDLDFVRKMQTMERYMLVRYFHGAEKLEFRNIQIKNSNGDVQAVPAVTFLIGETE